MLHHSRKQRRDFPLQCKLNTFHPGVHTMCVAELLNTEDRPAEPLYLQPGIFIIFSVYSNVTEECWQVKEMVRER